MSMPSDRRTVQRLATRRHISTVATQLFVTRGFDNVTIDEIAAAAGVGRMTVFNHFPRKEDLFFDRTDEVRELVQNIFLSESTNVSPLERLRLLASELVAQHSPYVEFSDASQRFVEAIEASEALKTRARGIRGELTGVLTAALAARVGHAAADAAAEFASATLVATWTVALIHGHRTFRLTASKTEAEAAFLAIVHRGTVGLKAALSGTPYA